MSTIPQTVIDYVNDNNIKDCHIVLKDANDITSIYFIDDDSQFIAVRKKVIIDLPDTNDGALQDEPASVELIYQIRDDIAALEDVYHPKGGDVLLTVVGKDGEVGTQQYITAAQASGVITDADAEQTYVET